MEHCYLSGENAHQATARPEMNSIFWHGFCSSVGAKTLTNQRQVPAMHDKAASATGHDYPQQWPGQHRLVHTYHRHKKHILSLCCFVFYTFPIFLTFFFFSVVLDCTATGFFRSHFSLRQVPVCSLFNLCFL
jgi:hypothetical protein